MIVIRLGSVMEVKLLHSQNALPPIWVTLFGMVTDDNPVQCLKAAYPILVSPSGMVTEVKP